MFNKLFFFQKPKLLLILALKLQKLQNRKKNNKKKRQKDRVLLISIHDSAIHQSNFEI